MVSFSLFNIIKTDAVYISIARSKQLLSGETKLRYNVFTNAMIVMRNVTNTYITLGDA